MCHDRARAAVSHTPIRAGDEPDELDEYPFADLEAAPEIDGLVPCLVCGRRYPAAELLTRDALGHCSICRPKLLQPRIPAGACGGTTHGSAGGRLPDRLGPHQLRRGAEGGAA
jgi:hypothetical protein